MSSVKDVSGIPTAGKNLIIVAAVDNVLHFRIFDLDGKVVLDTDEKRLAEQGRQIKDLRKQLESLWPPHELTGSERGCVITTVTSIVGHTPPTHSCVDEYRDRFYHEHLLEDALKQGAFPPRRRLPRPEMRVILTPQGGFDREGRFQIRPAPETLRLTLVDRPLAPDQVEPIRWRLDDGPLEEMAPVADRPTNWSVGLSRVRWERGVHRVAVVLRTKEASPQEFTKTVNVYFRPPPPEIQLGGPPSAAVDRPEFRFQTEVIPVHGRVKVHLSHQSSAGPRFQRDWESAEAVKIDEPLTLEPGTNTIDVTAGNADAPPDDAESETTVRRVRVVYNSKPDPPPAVALEAVVLRDGPVDAQTLKVEGGRPIVVPAPRVRVEGKVEAEQELTQVEWLIEGQERPEVVPIRHEKAVAASQELVLTPGPRKVRLRAKTGRSEFAEDDVTIRYQPQVPELEDVTLEPPDPVVFAGPGPDPPVVRLKARLVAPGDRLTYRAVLLINGKRRPTSGPSSSRKPPCSPPTSPCNRGTTRSWSA